MIRRLALATLVLLSLAPAARGADELRYPDTAPGRHARAWFTAYAADEAAMRAFFQTHGDSAALVMRPIDARLDVWREMRKTQGGITPVRVLDSGPAFVEVAAHSENEGPIRIRFVCAPAEPHGLVVLRLDPGEDADASPTAVAAPPPKDDAELTARLGAAVDSLGRLGRFSGAVLLQHGATRLYATATGMAEREAKRPNTLETRFNLGSINKLFTAIAIRQLAARGKLGIDQTIDHYLPEYPVDKAAKITVRMLLDHRSGVPDFFNAKYQAADPASIRTLNDWFRFIRDEPLTFEPGSSQAYSNGGYLLLGMIVAHVSGADYFDYVRKHVFAPAHMTHTDSYTKSDPVGNRAVGYTHPDGGARGEWVPVTPQMPERGSPAGGGYSTLGDMLRFADALRDGTLPFPASDPKGGPIGLMAAGGSPGCNSVIAISGPYTLVLLSNVDPPTAERLGEKVSGWIDGMQGGGGTSSKVRVGGGH